MGQKQQKNRKNQSSSTDGNKNNDAATTNKPRNLLITDATTSLEYEWISSGQRHKVTVHQSADDDTWPGGAVWDLGWCMGQLLVALIHGTVTSVTTTTDPMDSNKRRSVSRTLQCPKRLSEEEECASLLSSLKQCRTVLELGCGVGLTGMVVAKALPSARQCILTDLDVVVTKVSQRNVQSNTFTTCCVNAIPLCWGNTADETIVRDSFLTQRNSGSSNRKGTTCGRPKKQKGKESGSVRNTLNDTTSTTKALVDLILIGDVAYQHKPGAPSHFDILLSTLLEFASSTTIVVFGTRIRMPASIDLLDMMHEHFDEIIRPPINATEIDYAVFGMIKHNMTIHFLRRKGV